MERMRVCFTCTVELELYLNRKNETSIIPILKYQSGFIKTYIDDEYQVFIRNYIEYIKKIKERLHEIFA